jgi:hypothetical protein
VASYIKLIRGSTALEDMARNGHYEEMVLLMFIAKRARRTPCRITGLDIGEAMIGDFKNYGMTERKYRTAKNNLEKWGFSTFKTTNKGTVAKLIDSTVYDINAEESDGQIDEQPTDNRRATDEQATSNKNDNNGEEEIYAVQEQKPAKPNGKHNNKILFQQITEIYNDLLGGTLPRVEELSEPRQRALKARCSKKIKSRDTGNPEFWSGYFGYVANKCPFLVGENKDGWIANFDWLIKEANFLKVIEGTYERQEKPNASH